MAEERDLAKCRTVFESIDANAAVTNSVPRVIFERFLMRRYGIDVKFHYLAAKELEEVGAAAQFNNLFFCSSQCVRSLRKQIAQKSEQKLPDPKEKELDDNMKLHKSLDIDYDAAVQPITWQAMREVQCRLGGTFDVRGSFL